MSSKTKATAKKEDGRSALVPRLRFPEFRGKEPWKPSVLASACDMQAGKFVSASSISESNKEGVFPCYGGNGLRGYTATNTHDGTYPLIGRQGALCGNVRLATGQFHATEHAVVATPKNQIDVAWLYYSLDLLNLNRFATGQAQPGLSVDVLENVPVAIPPTPAEQQRIAECLSSVDELIATQGHKLDALKTHKKGLMQQLFPKHALVPKLRFPEFREAEGWKETQLQKIARPVSDRAVTGDGDSVLSLSGEHGLVLQSDYFGKKIAGDSTERYLKLLLNDFVYNDRTTKASTFGTIKRLSKYPSGIVSPIYKCFRFLKDENPVFWEWYFESGRHNAPLGGLVNEGARAGRFNISITQFLSTVALRPDEAEQQKIAECLSLVNELIAAQAQKLDALKTHKKGLMQQLFPSPEEVEV